MTTRVHAPERRLKTAAAATDPGTMGSNRSALESKLARRFAPFAAIGLLALLTTVLPPRPSNWTLVGVAAFLTLAIAAAGMLLPWSRLPRWTFILPPLAYFVVVALLRASSNGSISGYAPLAMLPVVWIALNLGRREVVIGIVSGMSVLLVPLATTDASYTIGDLRRAILWSAVATIVGFSVESLVREKRTQARRAREHELTMAAIADVTRALTAESDARAHICRATITVAGATFAAIWEPGDPDELTLTGHAGPDVGLSRFSLDDESSGSVRAFRSGERYLVPEAVDNPTVHQASLRRGGLVSMLFEPIVRSGTPIGVLAVGWDHRVDDVAERTIQAVSLLAVEAAVAIERADFLERLNDLAETDELTGLPNRRSWEATIRRAVGYAARTHRPLCVAMVDLDHFKDFNDRHGHQAGDRLLKSAAAAWRTALRQTDTLARYGGDEFAVALPGCSLAEAGNVLERLRDLTPEGQSCSVGLAEWAPKDSEGDLLARADEALYQAKRSGRDRLVSVGY